MNRTTSYDLWVFGYGSLMWRPGFDYEERVRARVHGYSRSFCVYSVHHRGVEGRPGLVLGLDRGGSCEGIAYRVSAEKSAATLSYLRAREQVNGVYREARITISLLEGEKRDVFGLTYVAERAHPSYVPAMPLSKQARLISTARGLSGQNVAYLVNTWAHLEELGIRDKTFERLGVFIGAFVTGRRPVVEPCGRAATLSRSLVSRRPATPTLKLGDRRRFTYRKGFDR
ncbi:MAG: gamma-glutamylcyclotransferase [Filomicrobium sp.]